MVGRVACARAGIGSIIRRVYALLIAVAVSIVLAGVIVPRASARMADPIALSPADLVWLFAAVAGGAAVGGALLVASASRAGLASVARFGLPGLSPKARSIANGLAWAAVAMLGVHFTASAFDLFPGGPRVFGAVLGAAFGFGTYRLHRHAIEHDAYRTFNLVAMLLAAGSLASMSITPTGEWWTENFSTLGTSDDVAAACFNVAIIVSGAGMAGLARSLTRALADERFGLRRGGLATVRALIGLVGVSLMGVGVVPIDGDSDLHNAFAAAAAGAFAVLCLGARFWAARLPRTLVVGSYAALVVEIAAMVAYDGFGLFNLTVFELIAFTLVFAWLIALVATTAGHEHRAATDAAATADVAEAAMRGIRHRVPRSLSAHAHPDSSPPNRVTFERALSQHASTSSSRRNDGHRLRRIPRPRPGRFRTLRPPRRAPAQAPGPPQRQRALCVDRVARPVRVRRAGRAMSDEAVEIVRNDEARRYELRVDGALAGYAQFRTRPDTIVFTHTVVKPEYGGPRPRQPPGEVRARRCGREGRDHRAPVSVHRGVPARTRRVRGIRHLAVNCR